MTILSFTDAEVFEDVLEDFGGGDGAGDGGEVVDGGAEVLGGEVCRYAVAECRGECFEICCGFGKRLCMAGVGYNYVVLACIGA